MLLSTSVCEIGSYNILFIGQKKSVINRPKTVNIAALLCLVTYRYAVFLVANLSVCDILAAEPPWISRNYIFLSRTTWTIIETSQVEMRHFGILEANKETQQGITCVSFWEKVSIKKKTWFGQIKENVMFWRKIQAKNFFFDEIQGEISQFLRKTS